MTEDEKRRLIRRHYLFSGLEEATLDRLAALSVTRTLATGEILFQKGDEGDALYGVLEGNVRIGTAGVGGKELILNIMEPGDVFGEIALLDGLPRTADARGITACRLLMIRRRDFLALLEREPKLAVHLIELLCERLRWTTELVEDAAFLSLPARLAKRLLALATVYGEQDGDGLRISLKLSQADLGLMTGASREHVNKQLQEWTRRGLVSLGRGSVTLRDRDALLTIAAAEAGQA